MIRAFPTPGKESLTNILFNKRGKFINATIQALMLEQVTEFKKRIEELDQSGTTYKSQLANQQSLQAQQEQISKNEI